MMLTRYFHAMRLRPSRSGIRLEWIEHVIANPDREFIQQDGRIRLWAKIVEMDDLYLRVVLLPDRETVHNAFDRSFTP